VAGLIEQPEHSAYARIERLGGGLAHAGALVLGVPLAVFLLPAPAAFAICPAAAYLISRRFRQRQMPWGSFQSLQAAVIQLVMLALVTLTVAVSLPRRLDLTLGTGWFLLLLYTLWGAVDTLFGYDFRYIYIGNWVERVSRANLGRANRRTPNDGGQG